MKSNIVLIGFMGSGKGQVGRALSQKTSRMVVDCDDLIESWANKKIKKIFAEDGEKAFREMERDVALWLEKNVTKTIVSTGGGFLNVPNLKKIGKIVYLHGDFNSIIKRIENHPNSKKKLKKRPLLADLNEAQLLYDKRLPLYRSVADLIVDIDKNPVSKIAQIISRKFEL